MQLLVYKINLLEYKYTLSLFWQSTAQILNKNQLFWTTTVKLSYLHALELNIKMKLNVLNRQQLSELSLIISTLHRAVAQTVKKNKLSEGASVFLQFVTMPNVQAVLCILGSVQLPHCSTEHRLLRHWSELIWMHYFGFGQ